MLYEKKSICVHGEFDLGTSGLNNIKCFFTAGLLRALNMQMCVAIKCQEEKLV